MTPVLLFPAALGALVALAVPLAIHLARRSDVRRIDFAALRWLAARPRPRTRLRFDEWLLLAVRLILLALAALWLARPAVTGGSATTPWVAVVPGASATDLPAGHRVWLAPGFPALDAAPPPGPVPVASLLRQLDAEVPAGATLSVVVPAELAGIDAERPRLSRAVAWRIVAGAMPGAAAAARPPPPALTIRYAPAREAALPYLRAAAEAWAQPGQAPRLDLAPASAALPAGTGALVWLAPGPVPAAVIDVARRGGTVLLDAAVDSVATSDAVVWADAVGVPLVSGGRVGRGRVLRLHRPLTPDALPALLDPDFPHRLAALFATPRPEPARVAARDFAPFAGARGFAAPPRDLRPWLALLLAALFLVERVLATGQRRAMP